MIISDRFKKTVLLLVIFVLFISCKDIRSSNVGRRHVSATNEIAANIAKVIGEDFIVVTTMIKPGNDPHIYKTSENDIIKAAGAETVLYNGYFLEGRLAEILSHNNKSSSISLIDGINKNLLIPSDENHFDYNPHFWHDVSLYIKAVEHTADRLVAMSPINERLYRKNEDAYLSKLISLDTQIRDILKSIPSDKRILVTAHNAFEYFGKAYGFETFSLHGIDTSNEIREADIERFITFITQNKINVIFTETTATNKIFAQVVDKLNKINYKITIGGPLYSDSLKVDDSGTYSGAYIETMLYNARTIAEDIN